MTEYEKILNELGKKQLELFKKEGTWEDHEWDDLVSTSQTTCMRTAIESLGGNWKNVLKEVDYLLDM